MILYELLTGVVPFEGETAVAIAFKQVSAVPRPPSELNPALPASLDAVVLRALAKDPLERYADDDELIAALEAERATLPPGGAPYDGHDVAAHRDPPTGVMLAAAARLPRRPRRRGGRVWQAGAGCGGWVARSPRLRSSPPSCSCSVAVQAKSAFPTSPVRANRRPTRSCAARA